MSGKNRNSWAILIWIAVFFCLGMAVWYGTLHYVQRNPDIESSLVEKLGVAGLTLAFGGVLGGVLAGLVKLFFDGWDERKKQKTAEQEFYRNILNDIKSVYDTTERARLLIAAHGSAKTYGEQMRRLPDAVVTIHNIKRALKPGFSKLSQDLDGPLSCCSGFLKALIFEFRDNYTELSFEQSKYEAEKKAQLEAHAKDSNSKINVGKNSLAWDAIKNLSELQVLCLDEKHKEYDARFLCHIDAASYILRGLLDGGDDEKDEPNCRLEMSKAYRDAWVKLNPQTTAEMTAANHDAALVAINWKREHRTSCAHCK